jgi:hypothetical protein
MPPTFTPSSGSHTTICPDVLPRTPPCILGNAKEGLCLDNGATANVVASNTIQQNGNRWGQSDAALSLDFVLGRLPDVTAAAKLPGISIDNGIYSVVYRNNISHNSGGGVKMVRTGFFNIIGLNVIENDNDGASIYYRFFGIELGAALGDAPSEELDFAPSRGNVIFSSLIRGSHGAGVFTEGGSDENDIFDNVIMDASDFAIESQGQWQNTVRNNLTNQPSLEIIGIIGIVRKLVYQPWQELVVPVAMELFSPKLEFRHLLVGNLEALLIGIGVDPAFHDQAGSRCGGSDEVDDDLMADEWLATPVLTDIGEEAVFDLVPLAGARREVANRDFQSGFIGQLLQFPFP